MSSRLKQESRALQALTGMSYQAALNQLRSNPKVGVEELARRIRLANSLSKQTAPDEVTP